MNIVLGERYKIVPKETKGVVKGEYGKTPAPIKDEIVNKLIGDEERITCRPADLIPNELDKIREEAAEYIEQDEDVLTYAMFPQVAIKFFEYRKAERYKIDPDMVDYENRVHPMA
jgi:oxaloacetate decarboxylase alpha subunit